MKNKYLYGFRISEKEFRDILSLFCLDIEAKKVSDLTGISRVTMVWLIVVETKHFLSLHHKNL